MPEFIKSHNPSAVVPQQSGRFTALSRSGNSPQFQVRSGLPGQPQNQPSPFDRINRDRSSHLRKQQTNHRRDSPTHSPIRSDSYIGPGNRLSPSRNSNPRSSPELHVRGSPAVNGAAGRNSPISRASPLSPLANDANDVINQIDPNKKIEAAEAVTIADKIIDRFLTEPGKKELLARITDIDLARPALVAVLHHVLQRAAQSTAHAMSSWAEIIKKWADKDTAHEAVNKWFEEMTPDALEANASSAMTSSVISELVILNLIEPRELETFFKNGKFHPLFFIVLKRTYNEKGIIYIQRNFGKSSLV